MRPEHCYTNSSAWAITSSRFFKVIDIGRQVKSCLCMTFMRHSWEKVVRRERLQLPLPLWRFYPLSVCKDDFLLGLRVHNPHNCLAGFEPNVCRWQQWGQRSQYILFSVVFTPPPVFSFHVPSLYS
jgi:hypothetical protein